MARYLRILRRRAAAVPFLAAVVARLPISMAPLGVVLLIQNVRGSYAIAGGVTAAMALGGAVAAPGWGRLLDRVGQPRVIASTGSASAVMLAALAVCADRGAGTAVLVALSAGAGLTFPVVSPAMRSAWRVVLDTAEDRAAAYAMDAVAVETLFVGGPLLLSGLLVLTPRAVPLLITAGLQAVGSIGYALTSAARQVPPQSAPGGAGTAAPSLLRADGVVDVLLVSLAMSVGFGHLDVSIAATARQVLHEPSRVGVLFAAISGGSALGGLVYGARHWAGAARRRLPVALGGFATGLFLMPLVVLHGGLWLLLALLAVTGVCIAPGLIIQQALVDGLAPAHRLGEAQSWLNTAITAGSAGGTALAGVLADLGGPPRTFLGAAVAVTLATGIAVAAQGRWRTALRPA
jgi:MFS family permease